MCIEKEKSVTARLKTMVDFNNEATVATSPMDVLKILIIQRRDYIIDCIQTKNKVERRMGHNTPMGGTDYVVKSAVYSLFLTCRAMLKRSIKEAEWEKLNALMNSDNYNDMVEGFWMIDEVLDQKKVTMVDGFGTYDKRSPAEEDKYYDS